MDSNTRITFQERKTTPTRLENVNILNQQFQSAFSIKQISPILNLETVETKHH